MKRCAEREKERRLKAKDAAMRKKSKITKHRDRKDKKRGMDSFTEDAIALDDQDTTSDMFDGRIINSAESSMSSNFMYKVVIGMDVDDKTYDLNFKEENNNGKEKISGEQVKDLYK
uniref:Enolase 2 n=1 Tax=Tanacetum cinerariifolium TaxID=118510 RepID=A0A699JSH6_TANCI|nr:enolase 2 [Tanacetum cinerariifolium]